MEIKRVPEMVEASKAIVQTNMNTWVGVWYDYKTHSLYTTAEKCKLEDSAHAYAVGQMIRPNTEKEVREMVSRWAHL